MNKIVIILINKYIAAIFKTPIKVWDYFHILTIIVLLISLTFHTMCELYFYIRLNYSQLTLFANIYLF